MKLRHLLLVGVALSQSLVASPTASPPPPPPPAAQAAPVPFLPWSLLLPMRCRPNPTTSTAPPPPPPVEFQAPQARSDL